MAVQTFSVSEPLGKKDDQGKQGWYALPLALVEPLAEVAVAGEKKYQLFNILEPFHDPERRFYDAMMRHLKDCQLDLLKKDEETDCHHLAQVAFNALALLYHIKDEV